MLGSVIVASIKRVVVCVVFTLFPSLYAYAGQAADSSRMVYDGLPGTEFNLFLSTIKVIAALGITLLLLIAAVWLLKKIMRLREIPGISGGAVTVLEMRYIAPKKSIALIRVLERVLIVGISDNSLTTLGELTPQEIENLHIDSTLDQHPFKNILAGFTGRKEKKKQGPD